MEGWYERCSTTMGEREGVPRRDRTERKREEKKKKKKKKRGEAVSYGYREIMLDEVPPSGESGVDTEGWGSEIGEGQGQDRDGSGKGIRSEKPLRNGWNGRTRAGSAIFGCWTISRRISSFTTGGPDKPSLQTRPVSSSTLLPPLPSCTYSKLRRRRWSDREKKRLTPRPPA
jgi:hypothetical protein